MEKFGAVRVISCVYMVHFFLGFDLFALVLGIFRLGMRNPRQARLFQPGLRGGKFGVFKTVGRINTSNSSRVLLLE